MEDATKTSENTPVGTGRWVVDPVHSQVAFTVIDPDDLKIIGGRFTDFSGEILVDENGTSTISGALKVASLGTDDDERDEHLRSTDYLNAGAHPEFRLEPSKIAWHPNGAIRIDGLVALRAAPESIQLEGDLIGVGRDGKGNERLAVITSGSLRWGSLEVRLTLGASAIRET